MNQDREKDVSTTPTCAICNQVILMVVERWGRMKGCQELIHVDCLTKTFHEQMNRGVTNEKLCCELCTMLCHLSPLMGKLLQDRPCTPLE